MTANHPELKLAIPEAFRFAQYHLRLQAIEPLHLNEFKGSALRGGFGHIFKRLACRENWLCDKYCKQGNRCAYGYIFETAPPEHGERLRTVDHIPHPFLLQVPDDPRPTIMPGETMNFDLVLIGRGMDYLGDFERVFRRLGEEGLGRSRGAYELLQIQPVAEAKGEQIVALAKALAEDEITLEFLTPARLMQAKNPIRQGPPFQVLIRTLLSRISSLSYFHCGATLEADFRGLIDQAAAVTMANIRTHWLERFRRSERQQQKVPIGGLVGQVTYAGDLRPYLPLLALGEFVHAGKGTVFGNGQYRIVR